MYFSEKINYFNNSRYYFIRTERPKSISKQLSGRSKNCIYDSPVSFQPE